MSKYAWRVLLYAMVKDEEELASLNAAVRDMREALATEECAIAVQVHAAETHRHWISKGRYEQEVLEQEVDGSKKETLTAFLNAAAKIEASSTALVIWAHGRGIEVLTSYLAKHGAWPYERARSQYRDLVKEGLVLPPWYKVANLLGPQWGTRNFLSNAGLREAIAKSAVRRVDLLGLNACVMAQLEVAYELRDVAGVMAFSQVFADPWSYGELIRRLSSQPRQSAGELGRLIVRQAEEEIKAKTRTDAVSAISSSKLVELHQTFDAYAARVTALVASDWGGVCRAVTTQAQRVQDVYQVDLLSLLSVLGAEDSEARSLARRATALLKEDVILGSASFRDRGALQGLSIFCPKYASVDVVSAYRGLQFGAGRWLGFLSAFTAALRVAGSCDPTSVAGRVA